jgi:hypothetical protein
VFAAKLLSVNRNNPATEVVESRSMTYVHFSCHEVKHKRKNRGESSL